MLVTQHACSTDRQRSQLLEELLEGQGFAAAQTQWGAMLALYAQGDSGSGSSSRSGSGMPKPS